MRTIPRNRSHISDIGRVVKFYKTANSIRIIRLGAQEANPLTAFIGAVIDVAEAAGSIAKYAAVKEETKQLLSEIQTIKTELNLLQDGLKLREMVRVEELKKNYEELKSLKLVYEKAGNYMLQLKGLLDKQRQRYPESKITSELEEAYLKSVGQRAKTALLFT